MEAGGAFTVATGGDTVSFLSIRHRFSVNAPAVLSNGAVIFPEGFVDTDEDVVHPFKDGAMLMALKANVPILPVYIGKRTSSFRRQRFLASAHNSLLYFIRPAFSTNFFHSVPAFC